MKKLIAYILAAFAALALLSGCMEETVPEEVEQRYIAYLESSKTSWSTAVNEYCHYEDIRVKQMAAESILYTKEYEINSWKKLSDNLWVVHISAAYIDGKESQDYYQFVGLIDGQYYVMVNPDHVPEELKGDLDLEVYSPKGNFVDVDDIIGF